MFQVDSAQVCLEFVSVENGLEGISGLQVYDGFESRELSILALLGRALWVGEYFDTITSLPDLPIQNFDIFRVQDIQRV